MVFFYRDSSEKEILQKSEQKSDGSIAESTSTYYVWLGMQQKVPQQIAFGGRCSRKCHNKLRWAGDQQTSPKAAVCNDNKRLYKPWPDVTTNLSTRAIAFSNSELLVFVF